MNPRSFYDVIIFGKNEKMHDPRIMIHDLRFPTWKKFIWGWPFDFAQGRKYWVPHQVLDNTAKDHNR